MTSQFSRRDFLKLGGLMPLSIAARPLLRALPSTAAASSSGKNVLIIVFDALSASNLSMHGYGRSTAPNLERLAKRGIVYQTCYAGSNFTSSGAASLLTGTLPWTHRAIEDKSKVAASLAAHNIFTVFEDYYRIAYTHNSWALILLDQLAPFMDELVPRDKLFLQAMDAPIHQFFYRDLDAAEVAWARDMKLQDGYSYSLFLSRFYDRVREAALESIRARFPRGVPANAAKSSFVLEHATGWLADRLMAIPQPFFGYFHFLPPHSPYCTSVEFFNRFRDDGFAPVDKPRAEFGTRAGRTGAPLARREYDEYILYADQAFRDFYETLNRSGLLENTWLVVTSDHGEMFERGHIGHGNPTLYEPVIRVPLIIFEPGRQAGLEIHEPTSAVDLLATLAHVTGHAMPDWAEGAILPPFSTGAQDAERSVFSIRGRDVYDKEPLTRATISIRKGPFKLIHYMGYAELGARTLTRLYDVEADPEELVDLAKSHREIRTELLSELRSSLDRANEPYRV